MEELLQRLRDAKGPDRTLDCAIGVAVAGFFEIPPRYEGASVSYGYERDGERHLPGNDGNWMVPDYTASIDAAIGLIEQVMKDRGETIYDLGIGGSLNDPEKCWPAASFRWYPPGRSGTAWHGSAEAGPNAPIAILRALFDFLVRDGDASPALNAATPE